MGAAADADAAVLTRAGTAWDKVELPTTGRRGGKDGRIGALLEGVMEEAGVGTQPRRAKKSSRELSVLGMGDNRGRLSARSSVLLLGLAPA